MKTELRYYFLSIILIGTVMMMTACSDDNNNGTVAGDPDTIEDFEEPEQEPTADALDVTIKGTTYVFDASYTGECKALVDRATDRATELVEKGHETLPPNEDVENIILHNNMVGHLSNGELASIIMVMSKGGSVVVADPTIEKLEELVKDLRTIITFYQQAGNNRTARYVIQMLNTETLNRIMMWTSGFDFSVYLDEEGKGDYMSLAIFSREDCYLAFKEAEQLTAYQYGQKADLAAEWMNTSESEEELAARRYEAARMMANRAGGEAEQYVDKIAKSYDVTYDMGLQMNGPKGYSRYHNCTLTYRIWSAYSKEKNCDVYCVTQTVTAYNQDLKCGPSNKYKWYNGGDWGPWKELDKKVSGLKKDVYGPYMKQIYTKCELKDGSNTVKLENYAPQNSTSGGQTETNGFTYGLGADVSVSANGPQAGISGNMSWSHTVSEFNADLKMTASPSAGGVTEWTYTGGDVSSHFTTTPWKNHTHEFPRDIQVTTCTVEQAWVWTVANSQSETVVIQPTFQLQDDWLTYDRAWNHIAEAYAHYIHIGDTRTVTPIVINCPPRHIQTWSMSVKTDAEGADVTKMRNYLDEQLHQYFLTSSIFYTVRADHKQAYNEGKTVEEYDEIGRFVYTAKDAFTNNDNVKEILREAAQVGGMPNTGSYTIVWRQTDAGINSDKEEFEFNY